MKKDDIHKSVIGDPTKGIAGLQDDWWTRIAPDIWNSKGSYLTDADGEEYLDLNGFFSTAPVRFDHPKMRTPEFLDKIAKVAIYRPTISDFWTIEMAEFVNALRDIATPEYVKHYFFVEGGGQAVENALKTSFDWKVRTNIEKGLLKAGTDGAQEARRPLGTGVIYFESAFHGRTGYTLSMTHTADPNKYKYYPKFDWHKIDGPAMTFDADGNITNEAAVRVTSTTAINRIKSIMKDHGDDIAAMIIEPIQAEGGDRHIPFAFFKELRNLCDENGTMLIYDEVQTGFGGTGKMWAHEHFGPDARPDIFPFAKRAQIAGIMASDRQLKSVKHHVFGPDAECKSRLNSTWGGHPVDMVRSTAILEIMRDENLLANATTMGKYFLDGLRSLTREFSTIVENPRGLGMMLAFDAAPGFKHAQIWSAFRENHILGLLCGTKTVRFRPHLDMTKTEVDDAIGRMRKGLSTLK